MTRAKILQDPYGEPKDLELVFQVRLEANGGYNHIHCNVTWVESTKPGTNFRGQYQHPLDGLTVTCQQDKQTENLTYAWRTAYEQQYQIELDRAEKIHHVLRHINTKIEELRTKFGGPKTFGQYVGNVAFALDIKTVYMPSKYSDWTRVDIGEAIGWIDNKAQEWYDTNNRNARHETQPTPTDDETTDNARLDAIDARWENDKESDREAREEA